MSLNLCEVCGEYQECKRLQVVKTPGDEESRSQMGKQIWVCAPGGPDEFPRMEGGRLIMPANLACIAKLQMENAGFEFQAAGDTNWTVPRLRHVQQ